MTFKNQKFKVPNNTVGQLLQKELIAQGYRWSDNSEVVRLENIVYYYTNMIGRITYGSTQSYFDESNFEEMIVVTENRLAIAELKTRREKVIVFGKTYFKDDVDAALSRLEIAQP